MTAVILNFNVAPAAGPVAFDRAPARLILLLPHPGREPLACAWRRDTSGRLVCDWNQVPCDGPDTG